MTAFPKLALGTWLMGGTKERDPDNDDTRDIAAIRLAINNGVTLIDTAQNYASGRCEELVGEAIRDLDRTSFQILTKQNRLRQSYHDVMDGCAASLKRLGLDYIDYFVCHAPNPDFDMRDFFRAANKLHKQGLIKNVGVSNFGPKMLELAVATSDTPIIFNQVHFSVDDDDVLATGTYDYCQKHDIKIQSYRTLVDLDKNEKALKVIEQIATTKNLSIQQITLAYINSYEGMTFTIKSSSAEHWNEAKSALATSLSLSEITSIRSTHQNLSGNFRNFLEM